MCATGDRVAMTMAMEMEMALQEVAYLNRQCERFRNKRHRNKDKEQNGNDTTKKSVKKSYGRRLMCLCEKDEEADNSGRDDTTITTIILYLSEGYRSTFDIMTYVIELIPVPGVRIDLDWCKCLSNVSSCTFTLLGGGINSVVETKQHIVDSFIRLDGYDADNDNDANDDDDDDDDVINDNDKCNTHHSSLDMNFLSTGLELGFCAKIGISKTYVDLAIQFLSSRHLQFKLRSDWKIIVSDETSNVLSHSC